MWVCPLPVPSPESMYRSLGRTSPSGHDDAAPASATPPGPPRRSGICWCRELVAILTSSSGEESQDDDEDEEEDDSQEENDKSEEEEEEQVAAYEQMRRANIERNNEALARLDVKAVVAKLVSKKKAPKRKRPVEATLPMAPTRTSSRGTKAPGFYAEPEVEQLA